MFQRIKVHYNYFHTNNVQSTLTRTFDYIFRTTMNGDLEIKEENLEEENCFDEVYEAEFIESNKSDQKCPETIPPSELKEATKSYLSEISQRLDEGEMRHIFVKKPKIEMENGYFSNVNKRKIGRSRIQD